MEHEAAARLTVFSLIFLVVALSERKAPRRILTQDRRQRWPINLGIFAIDTVISRLVFPTAAVGLAVVAVEQQWGLLNNADVSFAVKLIAGAVALDLVIYFQHVLFHAVPGLWRLHMIHHTDLDFDLTTALRFHPVEILLSMVIKLAAIAAIGAPPEAVLLFEILLNGSAMFNHSNIHIPEWLDQRLRFVIVTPDMHRIHHSATKIETNSNYGFTLSCWDRLFGTYCPEPHEGQVGETIGLEHFRDSKQLSLLHLLRLPWRASVGKYPINRE